MASGFLRKPCTGTNAKDQQHHWQTLEDAVYDRKTGKIVDSVRRTVCRNCGNQP